MGSSMTQHTPHGSLKKRLIGPFALFAALSMLVAISVMGLAMAYLLNQERARDFREIARQEMSRLEQRLVHLEEVLNRLSRDALVAESLVDPRERAEHLPQVFATFSEGRPVSALTLVDESGQPLHGDALSQPIDPGIIAQGRRTFRLLAAEKRLRVLAPVLIQGRPQGALIADFNLQAVAAHVFEQEADIFQHHLFTNDAHSIFGQGPSAENMVSFRFRPGPKHPLLQELGLQLEMHATRGAYWGPLVALVAPLCLLGIVMILAAVLHAIRLGNGLVAPILTLCQRVAHGDDHCAPLGTHDELETLALAFDARTQELWNIQMGLERRVAERTFDLAAANQQLKETLLAKMRADHTKTRLVACLEDSEKLLRLVLDAVPIRIFWKDRNGLYLGCNRSFADDLGLDDPADVVGKDDAQLGFSQEAEHFRQGDREVMASGLPKVTSETFRTTPSGQGMWQMARKIPLTDGEERIIGVIGTYEDITQRRQAREELITAKELAEAASQAKSRFLANMSHELRTPLNIIINLTYLALSDTLSDSQRGYLDKAQEASHDLLRLIEDVLDYSNLETDRLTLRHAPFDLESLLAHLARLISFKGDRQPVEVHFDVEGDVPRHLMGDPERLGQVLANLAGNAVKFTEQGEVVITIAALGRTAEKVTLSVTVSDTGIGIAPDQLEHLFDVFTQADGSHTRKHSGTGLGLALSRRLARLMGGDIHVTSEPGQGSTFTLMIPLSINPHERRASTRTPPSLRGARILLVDDSPVARTVLTRTLTQLGLAVESVPDGPTALDRILAADREQRPFQAILLDWQMPGMSGVQVARALHQQQDLSHRPRLILLTAHDRAEPRLEARDAGIDLFLAKPTPPGALLAALLHVSGANDRRKRSSTPVTHDTMRDNPYDGGETTDNIDLSLKNVASSKNLLDNPRQEQSIPGFNSGGVPCATQEGSAHPGGGPAPEALLPLLGEIEGLLERDLGTALERFRSLQQLLNGDADAWDLKQLGEALADFEMARAGHILQQMKERLALPGGGMENHAAASR